LIYYALVGPHTSVEPTTYGIVGARMSVDTLLAGLNPPQRTAVTHTTGPLLILAGAGAGKTRVITHRIAYLIHQGIPPHQILAVTFTNKAASEMRERVDQLLTSLGGGIARAHQETRPLVTTFHSFGVRILREHHQTIHLHKSFTIYDRSDSVRAIKKALEKAGYSPKQFEPRKILSAISKAKGDAETRQNFTDTADSYFARVVAEVWEHYQAELTREHALDFDDLLLRTYTLIKDYPVIREVLQDRYQYIHVDEYQDTNRVQFEIIRLLAGTKHNLCVVGDVDQNIYSWRGADIKNVLQFEKYFPQTTTVFLEENYRSTQTIIAASNSVIAKNKARIPKNVFTNNEPGDLITLKATQSGGEEADYVVSTIQSLMQSGVAPSEIAVLYRTNFQSRALEEAFLNYEVPYQLLGTKFFERKEIKDTLSFLRLALNPASQSDLARVINVPARGIGKVTLLKLLSGNTQTLTPAVAKKVDDFMTLLDDIAASARTEPISTTIAFIMKRTGIEADLRSKATEEDLERLENLQELVTLATRYNELGGEASALALIENAALQSDQDELASKETRDAVRLMTVHAAKGLEFPYVFITGLEEGLFPHERLDDARIDHEEERRLFYVALTRAGKKVFLTYAQVRTIFGSQRINVPSSFLQDIEGAQLEIEGGSAQDTTSGYERTIWLD
jgi:DNA helicase II / ATP-dependent DNA helicase PcrA